MRMGGQYHASAASPPGETRYTLYRRMGGPQGRSGSVRKISPPPGFDLRIVHPQRVAIPTTLSRSTRSRILRYRKIFIHIYIYIYIYMLSSKIENAHWAEKTTTTRCGIRETATTRNFVLWLFLKTATRCGMWRYAVIRKSCCGC